MQTRAPLQISLKRFESPSSLYHSNTDIRPSTGLLTSSAWAENYALGWIFALIRKSQRLWWPPRMPLASVRQRARSFDKVNRRSVKSGSPWSSHGSAPSFLPPRYQSIPVNKSSAGLQSTLCTLIHISQSVIRARSKMSRSLQGKYLPECHRESRGCGGESTSLCLSVFHCQNCEQPTLGQEWFLRRRLFHKVVCFCRVSNDQIGVGVLIARCKGGAATFWC